MNEISDKELMDDLRLDMLLTGTAIMHTDENGVRTRVDPADFLVKADAMLSDSTERRKELKGKG